MMVLELGSGRGEPKPSTIRLDADARLLPDIVCTLGRDLIALPDNSIDVALAKHVLEHIGRQGETNAWFFFWEELYRVLKPDAFLVFESPRWDSVWAWADPSHTRVLSPEAFAFLDQDNYRRPESSISPFRIRCDFVAVGPWRTLDGGHFGGTLRARKPLQPWWLDAEKDLTAQSV